MIRAPRPGLRSTIVASFALGSLVLSALFGVGTYAVSRDYLVTQRERTALQQAFADASIVRDGLLTAGAPVLDVLGGVAVPAGTSVLVRQDGEYYSSSLEVGEDVLPPDLVATVEAGRAGLAWTRDGQGPLVVVGTPLPSVGAQLYEVSRLEELERTLGVLGAVLAVLATLTAGLGAMLGRTAAQRVVAPLDTVAAAAAEIAAGRLSTRLPVTDDPDLVTIVGSFNAMADALDERLQRDARFSADVSHELRSPLTALSTSVQVLRARADDLPERSRAALSLVERELARFAASLEDLLELARLDAEEAPAERTAVDLAELARHVLAQEGASAALLDVRSPAVVLGDKAQLGRAVANLLQNADRHAGGATRVVVDGAPDGRARVAVEDHGPGVAPQERDRVFERFVRGGSRGSRQGTGLGLSIVSRTAQRHGGSAWCEDAPGGGARFVVELPAVDAASAPGAPVSAEAHA